MEEKDEAKASNAAPDGGAASRSAPVSKEDARLVRRGAHVVLRDSEGTRKVLFLSAGCQDVRMGRYAPIPSSAFLGLPYGVVLKYEDGEWSRQRRAAPIGTAGEVPAEDVYETNRHLSQDGTAQALTPSEVKAMKAECSGEQVVEALASNSASFTSKTKFAQEKYLKKKAQKHVQQVAFLRPSLMELCETYLQQFRAKVCGLRFDYLSSLLCHLDVRRGRRYLVLDSACGVVVAAMAQQMAGEGRVFRTFRGNGCSDRALSELDLGERRAIVRPIPWDVVASEAPLSHSWVDAPEAPPAESNVTSEDAAKLAARQDKVRTRRAHLEDFLAAPVDGLVAVAGDDEYEWAGEFLEVGMARLAIGGRLIVFGHQLQPLAAQQGALRASGHWVDVKMHQLHTREYQVLPQRTHPIMTADAMLCEGFLLMATKVTQEDPATAEEQTDGGKGKKRRRR